MCIGTTYALWTSQAPAATTSRQKQIHLKNSLQVRFVGHGVYFATLTAQVDWR